MISIKYTKTIKKEKINKFKTFADFMVAFSNAKPKDRGNKWYIYLKTKEYILEFDGYCNAGDIRIHHIYKTHPDKMSNRHPLSHYYDEFYIHNWTHWNDEQIKQLGNLIEQKWEDLTDMKIEVNNE